MRISNSASSGRLRGYTTRESHLKQLALQDETAWNQFYTKYRAIDPILLRRLAVKIIGSELIAKHGRDILRSCAKLHFKTASEL